MIMHKVYHVYFEHGYTNCAQTQWHSVCPSINNYLLGRLSIFKSIHIIK